jgi:NAD-dependent SIR2 family protein deacetylase
MKDLQSILSHTRRLCFFGGAGVSTASGIPDFRSADGLYGGEFEGESPESILSLERNQSFTILTEINKRGSDKDISFNFRVRGWEKLTEEITFN